MSFYDLSLYYLLGINVGTFLIFGYDKAIALLETKKLSRVSEFTLLFLTLSGGSFGALIAMLLLHHKIKKLSFVWKFVGVVILQVGVVGVFMFFLKG